jgi:hypothetical protein
VRRSPRLLALLIFVQCVQSQPPTPGPTKTAQYQQRQTTPEKGKSKSHESPSHNTPPVSEQSFPEVARGEEKQSSTQNKQNPPVQWWLILSTIVNALATASIAFLGYRQWRSMEGQRAAMVQQVQHMRDGLAETKKSVEAVQATVASSGEQSNLMRQQLGVMQASIAEAVRSSSAMENVAESMATSVKISREIADRQKLVTELQSRAYLHTAFEFAFFQDANHVFEVRASLVNRGNTPAYDVTFRAAAQIVPAPIPDDFAFPLPDESAGASVSLIAPNMTKTIGRAVAGRVPDDQVQGIKLGNPPRCLAMWGIVNYKDAFNEPRHLRFAFVVTWTPWVEGMGKDNEGNPLPEQQFSHDTTHHNDSN